MQGQHATYFLIPLSYVTILGGICTLIGTSTNLVVHSMIQEAGMKGFSMFELGKVGIFIAIAGIIYLFLFSSKLLPADRPETLSDEEEENNPKLPNSLGILTPQWPKARAMKITAETSSDSPAILMRPNMNPKATIRKTEK